MFLSQRFTIPILLIPLWLTASATIAIAADCNSNGVDDATDITGATSVDCNTNGAPDDCESGCPCADIVFLRDVTASKGNLDTITTELVEFTTNAVAQWGTDLRVGLITFEDFVTVIHPLTPDHATVVSSMLALEPGDGIGAPEASDEALRAMLEGTSICTNGSSGVFNVPFRDHCTKHAILITDALPGGCDDEFDINTDGVNAHQRALDAATSGIRIQAIFTGEDATARAIMLDYADVTSGMLYEGMDIPDLLDVLLTERVINFTCAGLDDCNNNQMLDECDIATSTSIDCDGNGRPDDCDMSGGTGPDCNNNDIPDECDITTGASADCNSNAVPDECDIAGATSSDCNTNSVADECETDCDANDIADDCEPGPMLFVDANVVGGLGDGTSWANAFPLLQDALAATSSCRITQLWVADGTYRPDQGASQTSGSRTETFNLINGLSIFGGFAGGETLLSQRDVATNVAILSGNVGAGASDSHHIVTAVSGIDATAILDGFTITGGRADTASGFQSQGAALTVSSGGAPTIRQCTFDTNLAFDDGGAVYLAGGGTFEDCTFINNVSDNDGGAVGTVAANSTFTNCTFMDNDAGELGGAMFLSNSSVQVTGSFFGTNGAGDSGGGMFVAGDQTTGTIDGCTFVANLSSGTLGGGGGVNINDAATLTVSNSFFGTNGALGQDSGGGGIGVFTFSSATIFNCVFSDNRAEFGGGVDVFQSTATIVNSTFSRNKATVSGGGGGGGLENSISETNLVNSVFRENVSGVVLQQIAQVLDSGSVTSLRVSHSNVQGGMDDIDTCGTCELTYLASNIDADPLFIDSNGPDDRHGTVDDNLRLLRFSSSIDAGSNGAVAGILFDFDGQPRIHDTVDMGAFEDFFDCNTNGVSDALDIAAGTSLDVGSNGIPDECLCRKTDVNCDGVTSALDLARIQAPLNWAQLCVNAAEPRTDVNGDGVVSALDLASVQAPLNWGVITGPCECFPDSCASSRSATSGGGSSMMSMAVEGSPWTYQQAELSFELRPIGGESAVTVLESHTTYELHYAGGANAVTGYVLAGVTPSAGEALDGVALPGAGPWSHTGNFLFADFAGGELITAPDYSGLYRTGWTTDQAVFPGESAQAAPSAGHLHTITTGVAGALTLDLFMFYADQEAGVWVNMEATKTYQDQQ